MAPDTPAPTEAVRDGVVVNLDVRDRPGVPEDFYDVYWTSFDEAGQVRTTARIRLPEEEQIITAGSGLVASALLRFEGHEGARLFVRDIRTGELVREVETELLIPAAIILDGRLYWAGGSRSGAGNPNSEQAVDGGVWAIALDGNDPPVELVEAGTGLGSPLGGRSPLRVSPSGRTIASSVVGDVVIAADIIDTSSQSLRARLRGEIVLALNDHIVVSADEPPTDAPRGWVRAVDIDSGEMLWRYPPLDLRDGFDFSVDSMQAVGPSFLGQFQRVRDGISESVIAMFDARDGGRRQILVQNRGSPSYVEVVRGLVSDELAGVANGSFYGLEELVTEPGATASILDLRTGELTLDAFTLQDS
jgi:hypothetical protein